MPCDRVVRFPRSALCAALSDPHPVADGPVAGLGEESCGNYPRMSGNQPAGGAVYGSGSPGSHVSVDCANGPSGLSRMAM